MNPQGILPNPILRYTIPPTCRERFLTDGGPASRALRANFLACGGLSDLEAPYDILRTPQAMDHAILLTLDGEGRMAVGPTEWTLAPGTVCLLPASGEQHYWTPSRWSLLWFHPMRCPLWDRLIQAPRTGVAQGAGDLAALAELFLAERIRSRPDSGRVLESLARSMALLLERETGTVQEASAHAREVEDLWKAVGERPEADWSLGICARRCGVSPRTLQTAVSLLQGTGVSDAITRIRMERARSLLEHTDWKVEDIANRVGYGNPFAFSRAFRRAVGQSPSQYRLGRNLRG